MDGDNIWLTFKDDTGTARTSANAKLDCSLNVCTASVDPMSGGCDNDPYFDDGETLAVNVQMINNELYDTPTGFTAQLEVDPAHPNASINIVNNTATWDVIPGGGSAYAGGVPFQIRYTANGGGPIQCYFKVYNITAVDNSWTGNASCAANSFTEYANTNATVGTTIVNETFDATTWPPTDATNWTSTQVSGTGLWARTTALTHPTMSPQSGAGMATFASYNYASGTTARLATGSMSFSAATLPKLTFYMTHDSTYTNDDTIAVQASTDGATWTTLQTFHRRTGGTAAGVWIQHTVDLTAYAGKAAVYIGFLGTSAYGDNMAIDTVVIANFNLVNDPQNCTTAVPTLGYDDGNWMFDDSNCNNLSDWTNMIPSPDAGESGSLLVYIGNTGNENAYGVTGTLTCPSCPVGVTICKNTATYGTIPYGTGFVYAPGDNGFRIALPTTGAGSVAGANLPFVVTLSGTNITTTAYPTATSPTTPSNPTVGTPTIQGSCTSPYSGTTGTTTDVWYDNFTTAPQTTGNGRPLRPELEHHGLDDQRHGRWPARSRTYRATAPRPDKATSTSGSYIHRLSPRIRRPPMGHRLRRPGPQFCRHCLTTRPQAIDRSRLHLRREHLVHAQRFCRPGWDFGHGCVGRDLPLGLATTIYNTTGTGFGPVAANAIFNNPNFGLRYTRTGSAAPAPTHISTSTTPKSTCSVS